MNIDIDQLTEPKLINLTRRIVGRLRFMQQARMHQRMLKLGIGDRVAFYPEGRGEILGTRYNQKTITVITESGAQWNVVPCLLHKVDSKKSYSAEVIALPR